MEKKRRYFVKIPIYNIGTELYIGEESIPSNMDIKTENLDGCVQVVKRGEDQKIVIWLKRMDWTTHHIGLLTHELYHAVNKVFAIIKVEDGVDEEFCAYLLQYLIVEYSKKINSKKIAKHKLLKDN
jgi:uncharacterized protein YfaT (DUF1175 family)